jgi:hypothetical protein
MDVENVIMVTRYTNERNNLYLTDLYNNTDFIDNLTFSKLKLVTIWEYAL